MILHVFKRYEASLLTFLGVILLFSVSLMAAFMPRGVSSEVKHLVMGLAALGLLLPVVLVLRWRNVPMLRVLPRRKASLSTVFSVLLFIGGVLLFIDWFDRLMVQFFPVPDVIRQIQELTYWDTILEGFLLFLSGVIITVFAEEFLFRGVLQQSLLYSYRSHLPALIIPSIIFALLHGTYFSHLPSAIQVLLLSFCLGYIVDRTGNILFAMLAHAIQNSAAFLSAYHYGRFHQDPEPYPAIVGIVSIIAIISGIILLQGQPDTLKEEIQEIEAPLMDEE